MIGIPIQNASDTLLSANPGSLPDLSSGILDWFQSVQYIKVTKVVVNYEIVELLNQYAFQGVCQPLSPTKIQMKKEGQRNWEWMQIHALPTLILVNDDIIYIENTRYRIEDNLNYSKYGYVEYHAVNDYQDTSKAPPLPNEDDITKFVKDLTITDPLVVNVVVSLVIPDAKKAIWCLFDSDHGNVALIGAVKILTSTIVEVTVYTPGNYRLIGAY